MMLIAPSSCSRLSAAIVECRIRSWIIRWSLGTRGFIPCTPHIIARCSAITLTP